VLDGKEATSNKRSFDWVWYSVFRLLQLLTSDRFNPRGLTLNGYERRDGL
jgi:hypothetical protein